MMSTEYPTEFPAVEIASVVQHVISGKGDVKEAAKAAWLTVGYFLGAGVVVAATDPKAKAIRNATDADKLAFADSLTGGGVSANGFTLPEWLLPMILKFITDFLNKK